MMQRQPNAFVTTNDGLIQRHIGQIIDFMTKHRLPAMYQTKENDDTLETIGRPRVTQRFVPLDCHHLTVAPQSARRLKRWSTTGLKSFFGAAQRAASCDQSARARRRRAVLQFAPKEKSPHNDADALDQSAEAIVVLPQQAANLSNERCDRAMGLAHKLSIQLRAGEDRVRN